MKINFVEISGDEINDWESFHKVFKEKFGFPDYYGNNLDAWDECMTDIDDPNDTDNSMVFDKGSLVVIRMHKSKKFQQNCPEQYKDLLGCIAFVNSSRTETGRPPILAFMPLE